jgi:hypothetical protein
VQSGIRSYLSTEACVCVRARSEQKVNGLTGTRKRESKERVFAVSAPCVQDAEGLHK